MEGLADKERLKNGQGAENGKEVGWAEI